MEDHNSNQPFLIRASNNLVLRWAGALALTAFVCSLTLFSGKETLVAELSAFFGGTERTDAIGHAALFGCLTAVWYWTLTLHMPRQRVFIGAVAIAFVLGTATELLQGVVPDRGAALLDMIANWIGILVFVVVHTLTNKISQFIGY